MIPGVRDIGETVLMGLTPGLTTGLTTGLTPGLTPGLIGWVSVYIIVSPRNESSLNDYMVQIKYYFPFSSTVLSKVRPFQLIINFL